MPRKLFFLIFAIPIECLKSIVLANNYRQFDFDTPPAYKEEKSTLKWLENYFFQLKIKLNSAQEVFI